LLLPIFIKLFIFTKLFAKLFIIQNYLLSKIFIIQIIYYPKLFIIQNIYYYLYLQNYLLLLIFIKLFIFTKLFAKLFIIQNYLLSKIIYYPKLFIIQNYLLSKIFIIIIHIYKIICYYQYLLNYSYLQIYLPNCLLSKIIYYSKLFIIQNYLLSKIFTKLFVITNIY
jgi:hypothetical protein